jgi:cytochrome c oxidase subunit II
MKNRSSLRWPFASSSILGGIAALALASVVSLAATVASAQPAPAPTPAPGGAAAPTANPSTQPVATPPVVPPSATATPAQPVPAAAVNTPGPTPGEGAASPPPAADAPVETASPSPNTAPPTEAPIGSQVVAPAPDPAQGGVVPVGDPWYELEADKPHDTSGNYWLPKAVNRVTNASDMMFYAVLGLSIFFFVAITAAVVFFCIKYRHRPGHKPQPSSAHNDALEITWTVIPTIICVFLFIYGWRGYIHVVTPPAQAVEVQVLAYRWGWNFTHSNGVQDSDLHVPVNTPVRLVMTAKDVLHSFFVPVLRTKQDLVPRRYTYAWFDATKPGTYRLYCTEYCGRDHSQMKVKLVVHSPGGYERYLADKVALTQNMEPDKLGAMLYEKKGCNACHSLDGSQRVGPSFKAVFGTKVALSNGSTVDLDENYIRTSILNPQSQSRPGFPPSMPSFEGQLTDKEIAGLIAFIKSLK